MSIIAETHSHTVACGHAYSTITENARAAAQKGLRFLCITEHGPKMPDGPHHWFFKNLYQTVPDILEDVVILKGAEADIMDHDGSLDIDSQDLARLDWVIASYHIVCCEPGTKEDHTQGWLAVAENPLVDVIGHCGDARYDFDFDRAAEAFARNGKIVEINAHSFDCRPGARERCREIAISCKKYGVRLVCSADAHFHTQLGEGRAALEMLRDIGYPEELILNTDFDRFLAVAREKSGRTLL